MQTTHPHTVADILAVRAAQARQRLDDWERQHAVADDDPGYEEWRVWRRVLEVEADAATAAAARAP